MKTASQAAECECELVDLSAFSLDILALLL